MLVRTLYGTYDGCEGLIVRIMPGVLGYDGVAVFDGKERRIVWVRPNIRSYEKLGYAYVCPD